MKSYSTVTEIRAALGSIRKQDRTISLVPTMGNLHQGHISLVEHARKTADEVVVSIFVNPLQFGPGEDLDSYPRTLAEDKQKLASAGVDHLFAPTVNEMYPGREQQQRHTEVKVFGQSDILCGESRPTHFARVTTVVSMLFNIIQPDCAVFGRKDFQQLAIIRRMVNDLQIPVRIEGCPIVRESDGLAMSSRNGFLNADERRLAPNLGRILREVATTIKSGDNRYTVLETRAKADLIGLGFEPDYLSVRNSSTLAPASTGDRSLVVVAAARLGKPRLLDNIEVELA